jgi:hypothetical protein
MAESTETRITDAEDFKCVYCGAPYSDEMYRVFNTTCSADTCDMVNIILRCDSCKKAIYVTDDWGQKDDRDWRETITKDDLKNAVLLPRDMTWYAEWHED